MKKLKIIEILSAFNKVELNRLVKFVSSPYHNSNESCIKLLEIIKKKSVNLDHLNKEELNDIWSQIQPNEPYDDKRFRKLRNDLMKLIEQFIAFESIKSDPYLLRLNVIKEISDRDEFSAMRNSAIKAINNEFNKRAASSSTKLLRQYQISLHEQNFTSDFEKKKKSLKSEYVNDVTQYLDRYFVLEKLKNYYELAGAKMLFKPGELDNFLIEEILKSLEAGQFADDMLIQANYLNCLLLTSVNPEPHYDSLKKIIEKHFYSFEPSDQKALVVGLINHCMIQYNSGKTEYAKEYIEVSKAYLGTEVFFDRSYLALSHFRNILGMALTSGQSEWAEEFILKYAESLNPEYRDNAVSFNLARVYWYKKDYNKVLENLFGVEYEDMNYNLSSKSLLAAVYYELDEIDVLGSHLSTFRTYLNRSKNITDRRKTGYKNFISYLRRINNTLASDQRTIEKIRTDLVDDSPVVNKSWLLEKLEQMSK